MSIRRVMLASHKEMISLREWWLSSPECSLRGVSKPQSATGIPSAEGATARRGVWDDYDSFYLHPSEYLNIQGRRGLHET